MPPGVPSVTVGRSSSRTHKSVCETSPVIAWGFVLDLCRYHRSSPSFLSVNQERLRAGDVWADPPWTQVPAHEIWHLSREAGRAERWSDSWVKQLRESEHAKESGCSPCRLLMYAFPSFANPLRLWSLESEVSVLPKRVSLTFSRSFQSATCNEFRWHMVYIQV